jgi:hypothetical protein
MFNKHGFFHLDTIEDDRSPGVHTYFFAKSFSDVLFKYPVKRLGIIGGNDNYALMKVANTIASIPKSNNFGRFPPPLTIVSDPFSLPHGGKADKVTVKDGLKNVISCFEQEKVSHLLVTDSYNYPYVDFNNISTGIEVIDIAAITRAIVNARNKKCLLVAADIPASMNFFDIDNVQIPGHNDMRRINEIIGEIRMGYVSPAYYKHEIATIALFNDCNCIVLGSVELHSMFGPDKLYNGVEIFDPWMEVAIIIQNNRMMTA